MGTEIYFAAVVILVIIAVFDLVVGVTNDAVNFLNSSIGSRVAPYYVILIIASLGILAGVTFSGGMMEVARKGIFHPQYFNMPELITIFLAVMLTDILLLDFFNTHGLPTSTTVSIVFELLGAAVAASIIKIMQTNGGIFMELSHYINTAKAMVIVFGILLSIVVAFFSGALIQFCTRLLFTFDYEKKLKRYGALWGGFAIASITFFILIKGAKGSTLMTPEMVIWIKANSLLLLGSIFAIATCFFQILTSFLRVNILKIVVIVGTFALAMAFAANDLMNFIGVPLAGITAFNTAIASGDPLNTLMSALGKKVQSQNYLLLIAGAIMVLTLWFSKKAKTVTETEIRLSQQDEGVERFESIWISRRIVRMADSLFETFKVIVPKQIRKATAKRLTPLRESSISTDEAPAFDLVRASVNLVVASAVVSFATSLKLPLSTTYVTFMVAMGTSFSDQAWGRESAVYRVTGVLTVIGGWFMTAFMAFIVAFIFAGFIHYFQAPGVIVILLISLFLIWSNHQKHKLRVKETQKDQIFNLEKINNQQQAVSKTFEHMAILLKEIRESFEITFEALFVQDNESLKSQRKKTKLIQGWANIIMANVFKVLRLLQTKDASTSYKYAQTIRRLQKISDGHRDIVLRSYLHTRNKHAGLLDVQVEELRKIKICIMDILIKVEDSFNNKEIADYQEIVDQFQYLRELADKINMEQSDRIRNGTSKTRLSILFYAIIGDCLMLSKQNIKLFEIFNESFSFNKK